MLTSVLAMLRKPKCGQFEPNPRLQNHSDCSHYKDFMHTSTMKNDYDLQPPIVEKWRLLLQIGS